MTRVRRITRRRALKVAAGAAGAALPLVHVQSANAAGKLTMGVWDHWVPAANPVLKGLIDDWAAKNKVDVTIDFIASTGNKIVLTFLNNEVAHRNCRQPTLQLHPALAAVDGKVQAEFGADENQIGIDVILGNRKHCAVCG